MIIKRINHYELHFNSGNESKTLLFTKDDCEIVVLNLKTDYVACGGDAINNYRYDSLDVLIKADDKEYDNHNFDLLNAIKKMNVDDLCSIVVVYTDGSELVLYPTNNVAYIEKIEKNEYLHVLYT